jgi:hypothetical protein
MRAELIHQQGGPWIGGACLALTELGASDDLDRRP